MSQTIQGLAADINKTIQGLAADINNANTNFVNGVVGGDTDPDTILPFLESIGYDQKSLSFEDIATFFDRASLNAEYVARFGKGKKPYSYIQSEINFIYGMQKCVVARYKNRMGYYRDALSQKGVRTQIAVNYAVARHLRESAKAENPTS